MNWSFILVLFYGICAFILFLELRRTPGYGEPIRHEGRVYVVFQTGSTVVTCSDPHPDHCRAEDEKLVGSTSQILQEGVS